MACETETKKQLVSFLYTYQAHGKKTESERAQQLAVLVAYSTVMVSRPIPVMESMDILPHT